MMYWHKAPYQMRSLLSTRDRTIRQLKLNLLDKQQAINNYELSVSKLKEWLRIYKVLRDAHKNHRRKLEAGLEERTKQFHLAEAKVMSREAIIEQLSETELAKDVTRLEGESEALHILRDVVDWSTKSHRERYQEGTMKCELCEAWDKYSGKIALLKETD